MRSLTTYTLVRSANQMPRSETPPAVLAGKVAAAAAVLSNQTESREKLTKALGVLTDD